ncbi:major head protein [Bacillus phage Wes44]|uniref:Major capsid protein n=1 Tax=Bacillus phage Wes44 TaxID=2283012 RepID=A0A346FK55_9CAUD|nr:major head protein [Bacillus phage Wes44]AXN58360.1 major capsid protein [Bacillus phage Wes44]
MANKNNNQSVRSYQKEFKQLLPAVIKKQTYFSDFFGGIEALDGVQQNDIAFYVKTSDIPVVVGTAYNKDPNVGFGTGTGKSTRFGPRQEIIYTDMAVPYDWEYTWHEGIDRWTVNNNMEAAMADRIDLQAQAKAFKFDTKYGEFIAANAGKTEALKSYSEADVLALFNALSAYYINIEAIGRKVAKVTPELYNVIVDHRLTTTEKASGANVDSNTIYKFKGFEINEVPASKLGANAALVYIPGIGKSFTGITTARTIESEEFDGVAFQGAGKAGEFILDDNKPAVVKVTAPVVTP